MEFGKHAFILAVIESLHCHGSWTGKTHVQKALSLLHDSGRVPVPFEFVLYKHGPYSFEVEAELEQMQSYGAIRAEPDLGGYGVVLYPDVMADYVRKTAVLSPEERQAVGDVCSFVGSRNVSELERLATAAWIRCHEGVTDAEAVAARLHDLKPHIRLEDAASANAEVAAWLALGG